jgi:hypothetical protein
VNITTSSFLLDLDSSTASFKMPLQRLELNNFKSYRGNQVSTQVYADLTLKVIDFGDAPFMCIIGPNVLENQT